MTFYDSYPLMSIFGQFVRKYKESSTNQMKVSRYPIAKVSSSFKYAETCRELVCDDITNSIFYETKNSKYPKNSYKLYFYKRYNNNPLFSIILFKSSADVRFAEKITKDKNFRKTLKNLMEIVVMLVSNVIINDEEFMREFYSKFNLVRFTYNNRHVVVVLPTYVLVSSPMTSLILGILRDMISLSISEFRISELGDIKHILQIAKSGDAVKSMELLVSFRSAFEHAWDYLFLSRVEVLDFIEALKDEKLIHDGLEISNHWKETNGIFGIDTLLSYDYFSSYTELFLRMMEEPEYFIEDEMEEEEYD